MPIQDAIRDIEIRAACMILHLSSGKDLKFRMERVELPNGKTVDAAVVRFVEKVIWSSVDTKG